MAYDYRKQATITIPADYLEEVCSAVVAEIQCDSDGLRAQQNDLTEGSGLPEDRDSAARVLRQDFQLLEVLLDASGDTDVTATRETLFHTLERMCRLLTVRLAEEMEYGPVDMSKVLELVARMNWAATMAAPFDSPLAVA